jgi:hypothetical protein
MLRAAKLIAASDPSSGNLTPQVTSPPPYRLSTYLPSCSPLCFLTGKKLLDIKKCYNIQVAFFGVKLKRDLLHLTSERE